MCYCRNCKKKKKKKKHIPVKYDYTHFSRTGWEPVIDRMDDEKQAKSSAGNHFRMSKEYTGPKEKVISHNIDSLY
jgi:hypothetical protein